MKKLNQNDNPPPQAQSANDCWTAFDLDARSGHERLVSALFFAGPTTLFVAESAAFDKVAFFVLAGFLRDFDLDNMTLILTPHV